MDAGRLSELSVRRHKCPPEVASRARSKTQDGVLLSDCSTAGLLDYLALWRIGSRMIIANMGFKLFVALQLEVLLHFLKRFASGRTRGLNNHAQSEQPQPWKLCDSVQTISRRMLAAIICEITALVLFHGTFRAMNICILILAG